MGRKHDSFKDLLDMVHRVHWEALDGVQTQKTRENLRAREAENLLREGERLLRNDPEMQIWRRRVGEHLARFRDYEQRPSEVAE